jgi:LysR family transcriptional regulator, glycine cleavage system transcriptional activator
VDAEAGRQRLTASRPATTRLARLQEHHPSVDLVATNRLCDFAREQIDLPIRHGAGQWRGLAAHRLMPELHFPVAIAEFLRRQRGRDPAELLRTSCTISNALHPDEWTEWCGAHSLQPPRTSNMIVLSWAELVVPALLDGVGIGIGRRPIIDPLLKDGRLVPLFRDRAIGKAAYYLVQPPTSRSTAARTVAEWLLAEGRAAGGSAVTGLSDREKTKRSKGLKR